VSEDGIGTEAAFPRDLGNVLVNCVSYAATIVARAKCRHQLFALNLTDESVRQVPFQMPADLREVFSIFNGDEQQEAWLLHIFRADTPAAGHRERIIENVLAAGAVYGDDRELYLLLLIQFRQSGFQLPFSSRVEHLRIVIDVTGRRRQR